MSAWKFFHSNTLQRVSGNESHSISTHVDYEWNRSKPHHSVDSLFTLLEAHTQTSESASMNDDELALNSWESDGGK